ncbi:hypothetical protein [Dactylosporangium sp. NPDC049140]|uniref:hypothetical protein n=1 Tax=Dactylosporangium sp. NPDC049140 TaxID=3155647 RepID=UPI0033D5B940
MWMSYPWLPNIARSQRGSQAEFRSMSPPAPMGCCGGFESKVILFLTSAHLREMLDMKDRGDDPTDLMSRATLTER